MMEKEIEPEILKSTIDEKRLDSWKEIAFYLNRDVRTVYRWEKYEALPVHRHLHEKARTVYAFKSELDAWLQSRRTAPESPVELVEPVLPEAPGSNSRKIIVASLLAILIVGGIAAALVIRQTALSNYSSVSSQRIKLAVLPFENLDKQPEQDYFSDGMTEEVITQLARLEPEKFGLIGRTSVMHYKNIAKSLVTIGQELDVDYILEGSVRREADRVRVTAQLIRVKDQTHLWAETYDQKLQDVLSVQTDVSRRIAEALAPKLLPGVSVGTNREMTGNSAAYDAYLKGRYALNRGTPEQLDLSAKFFSTASELDPSFALSYTGLAQVYIMMASKKLKPEEEYFTKAGEAARKALALDNNLAEAYSVSAMVKLYWEWDFDGAEKDFRRAIDIYPALANAHHGYADLLSVTGRHDEAIREGRRAQELEPLSAIINSDTGWFYFRARRYDEAIAECRKVLELEPGFSSAQSCVTNSLKLKGSYREALAEEKKSLVKNNPENKAVEIDEANPQQSLQNIALWRLGQLDQTNTQFPYYRAYLHTQLGQIDNAFQWLEAAYKAHDQNILQLAVSPSFDTLKTDSRFADLIKRIGIPPAV